jgi:hypothetical protein
MSEVGQFRRANSDGFPTFHEFGNRERHEFPWMNLNSCRVRRPWGVCSGMLRAHKRPVRALPGTRCAHQTPFQAHCTALCGGVRNRLHFSRFQRKYLILWTCECD